MVDENLEAASKDVAVVHIEEKADCIVVAVAAVGDSTDFALVVVDPMTVDADFATVAAGYCKADLPDQVPHLLDNSLTLRV